MQDKVLDGETTFGFDELFFSRTDGAGIIQYGNSVFQRVSVYGWEELLSRPHKIVRHPDTPRAVFWLLWDTIKRGEPIGAYVKNRAKDGRYYWVFAVVTPVPGGYLSVRLRPSSDLFATVKQEYVALADAERRDALAPADSAKRLLARLKELGFNDYASFAAAALGAEMAARDAKLGRRRDTTISLFEDLIAGAQVLLRQTDLIFDVYLGSENVPFNFRVLAAQSGREGAALSIISGNYSVLSTEMKGILGDFAASAQQVYATINEGLFLACTARLQRELVAVFKQESAAVEDESRLREMDLLNRQQRDYGAKAIAGLQQIAKRTQEFQQACGEMNRLAAGLEVTRIMGKVEGAQHTQARDRLDELLNDLERFQTTIAAALKEIERRNQDIQRHTSRLLVEAAQAA